MLEQRVDSVIPDRRRRLVQSETFDSELNEKVLIRETTQRTFRLSSRRRLAEGEDENELAAVNLRKFGGDTIEEISSVLPPARSDDIEDMKEFADARRSVLEGGAVDDLYVYNFEGEVSVEEELDLVFDPDLVINPH